MTCPCSNPCPDDEPITPVAPLVPDSPSGVEPLPSDDCNCGCGCGCSSRRDNPGINIQSTNECLSVDTSECGVVKLTSHCPPVVEAGDNITVDVSEEDGHIVYTVNSECDDKFVSACEGDRYPGTLEDKLEAGYGINIDAQGCSGSNAKIVISVDEDICHDTNNKVAVSEGCSAEYLEDVIDVDSDFIKMDNQGCRLVITDKQPKQHFAKCVLKSNYVWGLAGGNVGDSDVFLTKGVYYANGKTMAQMPYWNLYNTNTSPAFVQGMEIDNTGGICFIRAKQTGLYNVGFNGSVEISYGVHAFRVQLYLKRAGSTEKTILESRYSGPLGWSPCDANYGRQENPARTNINPNGPFNYVAEVSGGGGESAPTVTRNTMDVGSPLLSRYVECMQQEGHSASLGAYVDRIPVTGQTIIKMNNGDQIYLGIKLSTSVDYQGDILGKITNPDILYGYIALLGSDYADGDNGGECGFSVYASMLQPLTLIH